MQVLGIKLFNYFQKNEISFNELFEGVLFIDLVVKNNNLFGIKESEFLKKLSDRKLKLLNELQLLNIHLINNKISNEKRKEILTQHSINYKLINK